MKSFPSVPYIVPFVLYLALNQIPSWYPNYYHWLYPAVVVIVGTVTCVVLRGQGLLYPHADVLAGVVAGLFGIGLWIGLSTLHFEQTLSSYLPELLQSKPRPGFNPFNEISESLFRWAFLAMRLAGLVVLVPIVEELFWRGFLNRWLIAKDWEKVPLGRFTPASFTIVTVLFTLVHPEWLAAVVYCSLLNLLLYWKRDLWNCIVAHATSNLVLAVYILSTGTWELW